PTRSQAGRPPLILSCSGAMCVIGSRQSGPNTIVWASPTLWKQQNLLGRLWADRGQSSRLRRVSGSAVRHKSGQNPELRKYAPKWCREQPATPDAERLRSSIARWSTESHQNRQIRSLRPEPLPELPARREDGLLPLMGRSVKVAAFAVLVALL